MLQFLAVMPTAIRIADCNQAPGNELLNPLGEIKITGLQSHFGASFAAMVLGLRLLSESHHSFASQTHPTSDYLTGA
ncbi:hypothetical protein ACSSVY_001514 [Roseovarius sp. MBR-51]